MNSSLPQFEEKFVLGKITDELAFVFPFNLITEILLIEKKQILHLPFYQPEILGIFHHSSQIVPLISLRLILGFPLSNSGDTLTVIRLSDLTTKLKGVGLVVDGTIGTLNNSQLPSDLFETNNIDNQEKRLFQLEIIAEKLWQPWRWQV